MEFRAHQAARARRSSLSVENSKWLPARSEVNRIQTRVPETKGHIQKIPAPKHSMQPLPANWSWHTRWRPVCPVKHSVFGIRKIWKLYHRPLYF